MGLLDFFKSKLGIDNAPKNETEDNHQIDEISNFNIETTQSDARLNAVDPASFFEAVQEGDLDQIKTFIEQGFDVNTKDESGKNALYKAVFYSPSNVLNIIDFLLENGVDFNEAQSVFDGNAVFAAARNGAVQIVEKFVEAGADPHQDFEGRTLMQVAFENLDIPLIKYLSGKGIAISNELAIQGFAPVSYLSGTISPEGLFDFYDKFDSRVGSLSPEFYEYIVTFLIDEGIDVNSTFNGLPLKEAITENIKSSDGLIDHENMYSWLINQLDVILRDKKLNTLEQDVLAVLKKMDEEGEELDSYYMEDHIDTFETIFKEDPDACIPILLSHFRYYVYRSEGDDYAAFALGLIGPKALPQLLDSYSFQKNNNCLSEFFQAIGEVGDPKGLDILFECLENHTTGNENRLDSYEIMRALTSVYRCLLDNAEVEHIQKLIPLYKVLKNEYSSNAGGAAGSVIIYILLNNLDKPEAGEFIEALDFDEDKELIDKAFEFFVCFQCEGTMKIYEIQDSLDAERIPKTVSQLKRYKRSSFASSGWQRDGEDIYTSVNRHFFVENPNRKS